MLSFNLSLFDNYIKLNNKLIGVIDAQNMKDYVKEFYPKKYKFIDSKQKIRKKSFLKSIF